MSYGDDYGFDLGDYNPFDPGGPGGGAPDPGSIYNPFDPGGPGGGSPDAPNVYDPFDPGGPGGGAPDPATTEGFHLPKGFSLGDIGKGIGLFNKDGTPNWGAILAALALGGGAAFGINRTNAANDKYQEAIKSANAQATSLLGGNQAAYDPYKQAGLMGLQRLQNAPQSNLAAGFQPLADRYKPLGTGAGMTLGALTRR